MATTDAFRRGAPTVSVVMPTFNDIDTVAEAVESIRCQTFDSWELIVVDDASTDATASAIADIAQEDDRIVLIKLDKNSGSGVARNRAIARAVGEFVAIQDADDVSMNTRLELQVAEMRSDDELAVIASQVAEFGDWGGPARASWPTDDQMIRARQNSNQMPVPHPSCMFRSSILRAAGGYDESCRRAQDYALFLKLQNEKVRCLSDVLVNYRTSRPVSLGYVRRNARYADLALRRHRLANEGVPAADLPNEARWTVRTEVVTWRSWLIRSLREFRGIANG
ncbi:glycosyltransferase family 2 protein [Rhodococcus sp. B7740]|uniref:glycosyltransferase family 2 protein n=1 Tax=Rhodococcus sp. B7740 TaxID=1564114 RepID=UPI000A451CEC|nr:glycosyltransferase family 2 protein [Rhodococcus sp. B7740]